MPFTCGCDSAIEVRCPPADQPDTTIRAGVAAERRQLLGQKVDPRVDFGDDLVQRRIGRQRVADQRDIDAVRHRPAGEHRKSLLRPGLPVAAVDEQNGGRLRRLSGNRCGCARADHIGDRDVRNPRPHQGGGGPSRRRCLRCQPRRRRYRVRGRVPLGSARASPADRTGSSLLKSPKSAGHFHIAGKCFTGPTIRWKKRRTWRGAVTSDQDWCRQRRARSSTN